MRKAAPKRADRPVNFMIGEALGRLMACGCW